MANLLEGIGQAYAQDYRNVRKEREKREKDSLKQRLMYMALAPIGETLVQGAVNFIKQPFAEKHEDFVERENARGGIIQQRRNVEKEVDAVQKTIDTWNKTASENGMNIYDAARHTQRVRSNDEFNRIVGNDWRTAVRYTPEQRAKINSVFEAMQSTIDTNSVTLVDDSKKFVEDFGKGRFRSSEDIEKALEKNKLHGNAGQILLRKVKGIFSDEPVDLKAKARAEAAPNFYSFLQDRTEYNDSLARARQGISYDLKEQGLGDIVETATESERKRQVALRERETAKLQLDKRGMPLRQRELAQQEHFNIFEDGGEGVYSELVKGLDIRARRALDLGIETGKITHQNFQSTVGHYTNNNDGQGFIASTVRNIKNYETYNKIKTGGLSAVISEEYLPLAKKVLPFFSVKNSYQLVEEINSGDQDGFHISQAIEKLAEDNVSRISSDLIASSSESSLRKQKALVDAHVESFISKESAGSSDAEKIKLRGDLTDKLVTRIRAEVNQRLGNVLEDNQIFEVGKARNALTLLTDDLAQYGAANGFNFNEYQISEELEKSFSDVSEGTTTVDERFEIRKPQVFSSEAISEMAGKDHEVAVSALTENMELGKQFEGIPSARMESKDGIFSYESGTIKEHSRKGRRNWGSAGTWSSSRDNFLENFEPEDAEIIKNHLLARQTYMRSLETSLQEKLGYSYGEAAMKLKRTGMRRQAAEIKSNPEFQEISRILDDIDLPGSVSSSSGYKNDQVYNFLISFNNRPTTPSLLGSPR